MPGRSLNNDRNFIAAVRFKPIIDRNTPMKRYHTDEKTENKKLTNSWANKVHLSDEYANYQGAFLIMLSDFLCIWDRHLGRITVDNHCIDLNPENTEPIHSAAYRAGTKAVKFERMMVKNMLLQQLIEPVQNEREAPTMFVAKKNGALLFCVDSWTLNVL